MARVDLHPGACEAAYAAEAARLEGRFWAYHDALFEGELVADSQAQLARAARAGFDPERLSAVMASRVVRDRVRNDIELGIRLGVEGTPTLFVNRRRISNLPPEMLRMLVEGIVARHGK